MPVYAYRLWYKYTQCNAKRLRIACIPTPITFALQLHPQNISVRQNQVIYFAKPSSALI